MSSALWRRIYAEIEEVGWEDLVKMEEDLSFLSFRVRDKNEVVHILEIMLDKTYPRSPPSVSAHLNKFQEFWSTMDTIDRSLWVIDPKQPLLAKSDRQINLGNGGCIMLSVDANDPLSLPECRFLGSDPSVNSMQEIWMRNRKKWKKENPFLENLAGVLGYLPAPPQAQKTEEQAECGICYAQYLPSDDEFGANSGTETDYKCENVNCNRAFHTVCLGDWLLSITTTRQSFDVLFGNCPYCSDPIAIKMNARN